MTTVLAIDQGTSGTKAVVVDGSGAIVALYEVPPCPHYDTARRGCACAVGGGSIAHPRRRRDRDRAEPGR